MSAHSFLDGQESNFFHPLLPARFEYASVLQYFMDLVQRMRAKIKAMQDKKFSFEFECKEGIRLIEDMASKQREYLQQFHNSFFAQVSNFLNNEQITRKRVDNLAYEKEEMESWKMITIRVLEMQMKANEELKQIENKVIEIRAQNEKYIKRIDEDQSKIKGNSTDVFKEDFSKDGRRVRFENTKNMQKKGVFIDEKGERLRIVVQKQKLVQTLQQGELVEYELRYNNSQNKYIAVGEYPTPILKAISHFNFHKSQKYLQKDLQGLSKYV